eukprot:scaffold90060_cov30-Tisochrysis_lutea.AAC.3
MAAVVAAAPLLVLFATGESPRSDATPPPPPLPPPHAHLMHATQQPLLLLQRERAMLRVPRLGLGIGAGLTLPVPPLQMQGAWPALATSVLLPQLEHSQRSPHPER